MLDFIEGRIITILIYFIYCSFSRNNESNRHSSELEEGERGNSSPDMPLEDAKKKEHLDDVSFFFRFYEDIV